MSRCASIVVCLVLALLSLPSLSAPVAAQQSLPQWFLGTWEGTMFPSSGGEVPISIELTGGGIGAAVGSFDNLTRECGAELRLERVAADGSWVEVTFSRGLYGSCTPGDIVTLTIQNDGSLRYDARHPAFTGTATGTLWPTARCSWTGTWWSPVYGYVRLTQTGSTVSGNYDWDQGQISGTVLGDTLGGTWNEAPSTRPDPADYGEFVFTMAADCQSFTGQWRYDSSGQWYTDWSADRVSN